MTVVKCEFTDSSHRCTVKRGRNNDLSFGLRRNCALAKRTRRRNDRCLSICNRVKPFYAINFIRALNDFRVIFASLGVRTRTSHLVGGATFRGDNRPITPLQFSLRPSLRFTHPIQLVLNRQKLLTLFLSLHLALRLLLRGKFRLLLFCGRLRFLLTLQTTGTK